MVSVVKNGICHTIHQYLKANKYIKDYDKIKNYHFLRIGMDLNDFYAWVMSQKLPVHSSKLVRKTYQFNNKGFKNTFFDSSSQSHSI